MLYEMPAGTFRPHLLDLIRGNHTLIAGATGSGKSVLENEILKAFLLSFFPCGSAGANLILIDPKKVELREYKDIPHCIRYADNIADIIATLEDVRQLVNDRLEYMQARGLRQFDGIPVYIFVDEVVDLFVSAEAKTIIRLMSDIISISRCCSVYWVLLTQAPNRRILRPEIVLNLSTRVALRCNSAIESRQIIGDTGAEQLPPHGIAIVQKGIERYKIRITMSDEAERREIVEAWTAQNNPRPKPTPAPPAKVPKKKRNIFNLFLGCKA